MTSVLLKKANAPAATVTKETSVIDAVRLMCTKKIGAVVVVEKERAIGIFTERDLMVKVVGENLDTKTTKVAAVMTSPVFPIDKDATIDAALEIMVQRHIRHLPVFDKQGHVLGMLSMRHLMKDEIDVLKTEVGALENYAGLDTIGG